MVMRYEEIEKFPTEKLHKIFAESVVQAGRIKAVLEERLKKSEDKEQKTVFESIQKGVKNGKSKGKR